jgi:superfamily II DNA or RNA helicase
VALSGLVLPLGSHPWNWHRCNPLVVDHFITVEWDELRRFEWNRLFKKLRYADSKGNVYEPWRINSRTRQVILPRGAWQLLPNGTLYTDKRSFPKMRRLNFTVELDAVELDERFEGQTRALKSMFEQEQGLIVRPPGTGKTQIALAFCANVKTRTLILVHTEDILQQWIEYAERALPDAKIGVMRGKEIRPGHITIATVQTFLKRITEEPEKWQRFFGAVILDEAHHAAASTFEQCLNMLSARYRFGFTASPTRADKKHPYMGWVIGPVIHRKKFSSPVPVKVVPIQTDFYYGFRGAWDWGNLLRKLISDDKRNQQIAEVIDAEVQAGNSILILSRRIEHLERIAALATEDVEILAAATRTKAERKEILADFKSGRIRAVAATQLADEALDVPIISRVVLAHPGKHDGRIIQQAGRALREHPDKRDAVIYDVVDRKVGVLRRQWNQRKQFYKREKIKIQRKGRVKV